MKKMRFHIVLLFGLLLLAVACGEDEYDYPSVKLEFVTVQAGEDGRLQTLVPDQGEPLSVSKDRTHSTITPNTSRRVLSNYEVIPSQGGASTAEIYSLQALIVLEPKLETDPAFEGGMKTDPVDVISIWMGRDYLNMILNIKVKGDKQHVFGMVEEGIEVVGGEKVVTLSLYHDANGDEEYYNRRAYISVPLAEKYAKEGSDRPIRIRFKYHTYNKKGENVESVEYCDPGFDYVPSEN